MRPGDTLKTTWTIVERLDRPKHDGGIAVMKATCTNQHSDAVAEADGKMLVMHKRDA